MSLSSDAPAQLPRFTAAQRWVHRTLGLLMGVLIITGAIMFFPDLSGLVGNRQIVTTLHDIAGWLVPVPLLLALLSRAFRNDAGRLNRFTPADWQWLRSRDRRSGRIAVGKFNAGQKLNAALTLGAVIVMFGTGMVMFWSSLFGDAIRTGSTFVHDWVALALTLLVLGHISMAFNDATARAGMRTGSVPEPWAMREHREWAEEMTHQAGSSGGTPA